MDNEHNITLLSLDGHIKLHSYRYIYFTISFILYILIVCFNSVVIWLIFNHRSLHEPMYIIIAALLMNALFGSTTIFPKLFIDLLSDKQLISYPACVFQALFIYTYGGSEFSLLTVMAYDRYVSICKPLHYTSIIKKSTVTLMLLVAWGLPVCESIVSSVITLKLTLCKFTLNRIYCDNYSLVKASCGDKSVNFTWGFFLVVFVIFAPFILIMLSYANILLLCFKGSKDFRKKAFQTSLPHLLVFTIFTINTVFEIIQQRMNSNFPHIMDTK
ncbi:olfactory receptor 6N2-like [Aplochiton taeniatus]